MGRTWTHGPQMHWTHNDKGKLQLCGNELAEISFKQNDHITQFDGVECKYEHGFPVDWAI